MTAKEYLMQYRDAMRRTQAISDHLTELRAVCEQLRTEDGRRVALDAAVAELVDTEAKTTAAIERLTALETEIIGAISHMPDPYQTLLYERYINGKTWEQVAVQMNYSYRHTTKLHGAALARLKDVLECPT
jgi:DNA-directed RNA polymerase specialized sigma subunit